MAYVFSISPQLVILWDGKYLILYYIINLVYFFRYYFQKNVLLRDRTAIEQVIEEAKKRRSIKEEELKTIRKTIFRKISIQQFLRLCLPGCFLAVLVIVLCSIKCPFSSRFEFDYTNMGVYLIFFGNDRRVGSYILVILMLLLPLTLTLAYLPRLIYDATTNVKKSCRDSMVSQTCKYFYSKVIDYY